MPSVRIEPSGAVLAVGPDQTIFEAATAAGYRWPTVCGGLGTCHTCFLRVDETSAGALSPIGPREREGLDQLGLADSNGTVVRLACQVSPTADVVVNKPGVRPATS